MQLRRSVLVIDDNDINRLNLKLLLKRDYEIHEAGDVDAAEEVLAGHHVDLVVLDLALPPDPDDPEVGMVYLRKLRAENPDTPVVVVTGHAEHALASRARELGAVDFFGKPFDPDEVHDTISQAIEARGRELREAQLERELESRVEHELLGDSEAMQRLRELIGRVAPMPSTVLVQGETGTGKELVARRLHAGSPRRECPFVAINCAAMPAEHLESELFGYEKGAFAGAARRKLGWFELAGGGTLFLDEVAGLPLSVQGKLLRLLEHGEFSRLGGESVLACDVRLICSTKERLDDLVAEGRFRDDLYYRIHVITLDTPPLREHPEDIPELAEHFLSRNALLCNKRLDGFSAEAMEALTAYDWPGNVRELENVVERAVVLATGSAIESLPSLSGPRPDAAGGDPLDAWFRRLPAEGVDGERLVADFERRLLVTALERNDGVKTRAGRWLGFGDRAKDKMRYLCDKYDVQPTEEF